eukprot:365908-Chlamydomonas_euryale.AAC.2
MLCRPGLKYVIRASAVGGVCVGSCMPVPGNLWRILQLTGVSFCNSLCLTSAPAPNFCVPASPYAPDALPKN